jgi:hypothetical protein
MDDNVTRNNCAGIYLKFCPLSNIYCALAVFRAKFCKAIIVAMKGKNVIMKLEIKYLCEVRTH